MTMKTLNQLKFNNQRVLVRVDFNVPLDKGEVTDNTRIKACIPTIKTILEQGGRPVLMSHLGRPDGNTPSLSLEQLVPEIEALMGVPVVFVAECVGEKAEVASKALPTGQILLLENLRFHNEETKGDKGFAEALSKNGDFYINDAFGTAHRAHASTAVIAEFFDGKCAFGEVMAAEILNVDKVLNSNAKPVTAIVGGAKVSSKISIIENLIPKLDHLIIGGGMAYTFIKAQGGSVGKSLVEDDHLDTARTILAKAKEKGCEVHLPVDSVNADAFSNEANVSVSDIYAIPDNLMGLDVGEQTLESLKHVLSNSKVILWNGPMGVFEMDKFANGTERVAQFIAESTKNGAFSLVGGGDSVAAVKKFNKEHEVSYVSTGGGAMLEYLEGKELPGIKAVLLRQTHRG
jgi:phosphoglycerate kinase